MNKLCKIIISLVLMITLVLLGMTVQVKAATDMEELIQYISSVHIIKGQEHQIKQHDAARMITYLENNKDTKVNVNGKTIEENAGQMLANLKEVERVINDSTAEKLSDVPTQTISYIEDLVIETGKLADVAVTIDTTNLANEEVKVQLRFKNEVISLTYQGQTPNKPKPEDPTNPDTPTKPTTPEKPGNSGDTTQKPTDSTTNNGNGTTTTTKENPTNTTTSKKLVYTGKDYSFAIKSILAIVAVAIIGIMIVRKYGK